MFALFFFTSGGFSSSLGRVFIIINPRKLDYPYRLDTRYDPLKKLAIGKHKIFQVWVDKGLFIRKIKFLF